MSYAVMLDAIHADVSSIPVTAAKVAGYVTGSSDIEWAPSDWARFPSSGKVRIDQSPALAAWASGAADVADSEAGAASQASVIAAALERKAKGWWSFVYVSRDSLSALQAAVTAAGLEGSVQYWVADWSLSQEEAVAQLSGDIVAVQYASPSSNPSTVVPGGSAALSAANIDISVTVPSWFQFVVAAVPVQGLVVTDSLKAYPVSSLDEKTWTAAA
jgi:hypothetical protein